MHNDETPGSLRGLHLVMRDIEAARAELVRAAMAGEVFHLEAGVWQPGPDPLRQSYHSFASFEDPDGNGWSGPSRDPPSGRTGREPTSRRFAANRAASVIYVDIERP